MEAGVHLKGTSLIIPGAPPFPRHGPLHVTPLLSCHGSAIPVSGSVGPEMKAYLEVFFIKITAPSCLSPCRPAQLLHRSDSCPAQRSASPPSRRQPCLPTCTLLPASLDVAAGTSPLQVAGMGAPKGPGHHTPRKKSLCCVSSWRCAEEAGRSSSKTPCGSRLVARLLLLPSPEQVSLAQEAFSSSHRFPRVILPLANN